MKKNIALVLALTCLLLTGCAGTTVIYQELPQPDGTQSVPAPAPEPDGGAWKTGLAILTDTTDSESGEEASYEVAVAAVLVDESGVIRRCVIDALESDAAFDLTGTVTGDTVSPVQSLRDTEGDGWRRAEQTARYAVGKTAAQLQNGGDDQEEEWLSAVARAAEYARAMGAREEDELRLALTADHSGSASATGSEAGRVRLNCSAAAVTFRGETITSCRIDSVQADVSFDAMGTITGELLPAVKTKTELGEDYGMKRYGGATYEWYEQADHFAAYAVGKTAAQLLGLTLADGKPVGELAASVTISVTPFQALIASAWEQEVR